MRSTDLTRIAVVIWFCAACSTKVDDKASGAADQRQLEGARAEAAAALVEAKQAEARAHAAALDAERARGEAAAGLKELQGAQAELAGKRAELATQLKQLMATREAITARIAELSQQVGAEKISTKRDAMKAEIESLQSELPGLTLIIDENVKALGDVP